MNEGLKPVRWVGSSRKDIRSFPAAVRREVGHALYAAQNGETDPAAKPLKGFGGHAVMEIVAPFDGNTWRAISHRAVSRRDLHIARLSEKIEIGHRHPKGGDRLDSSAARGRRTPLQGKSELTMKTKSKTSRVERVTEGSGNVFADLGLSNADQEMMKARLTLQIARIIKDRGLTQAAAAKILGVQQPLVSVLMRNRSGSFSVGRLFDFLTALGQNVEIVVTPARKDRGVMAVVIA